MRWGIQNESSNNHSEVQTCLHEIEMCKKYSVATNFIVLLSHRYGSRPTPATIRATLFDLLFPIIRSDLNDNNDAQLLSQWYQLDTNRIPAVYVLRSISSILPKIESSNTKEMKQAEKEWKLINNRIRNCLRQAATKCFEQKQITQDEYDDFFISITEKEIVKGILTTSDANQRTLCFLREIENIHEHLFDSKISKYIDMCHSRTGELIIDSEAENLLQNLKKSRIPSKLQSSNIFSYQVHWTSNGINRHDHATYIAQFNDDFYHAVKQQIDQCVKSRILFDSDPLQHEILEHAIQCKTYVNKFHGRIDILNQFKEYVMNENENRFCIAYGDSGFGKTSLLAKIAIDVLKWWSNRSVSVILRFLGTTPQSSTMYKTLLSISQQICQLYNLSMDTYSDILQLRYQLETNLFLKIPENEYLLIVIDSIDQLESDAYDCQWLPKLFPKNIKCIVSTLPEHGGILSSLKSLIGYYRLEIKQTQHLLILIPSFESSTVEIIYNDWLQLKQRSLSHEQRTFIRQWMEEQTKIVPLLMKLMFDILCTWHSYDTIDNQLKTCRTVDDCIRYLFNHLQTKHNSVLFRRALCYMTACRSGISQNELEDVLSLDDDVLKSIFEHYIPPIQRLPGILWTRIRNDLDEYLTEKEIDDSSVIYWYHRRFIDVVNKEYLSQLDETEKEIIFGNMIDLYNETWKEKNKPFKIDNPKLIDKYHLIESNGEIPGNRLITSQPIEFINVNGKIQYNKRKLNELPQFLCKLSPNLAIPIVVTEVFFNYSFMHAKIQCSDYNDITILMQHFKDISKNKLSNEVINMRNEINILFMIYMMIGHLLQEYPNNYVFEFSSRLLSLFGIKSNITRLIKQFDKESIQHCSLIVPYCQMRPPGSGLVYSMNKHTTPVIDLVLTYDQMAAISLSDRIVVIDMTSGHTSFDVKLPKLNEPYLNITTLTNIYQFDENEQQYYFFVNSFHHIYFLSAYDEIKFEQMSNVGYATVEILDYKHGLCIIKEMNSNLIECWDLVNNRLFSRIDSISSVIKKILCINTYLMLIIICQDGFVHFYSITNLTQISFVYRCSIHIGQHFNSIIVSGRNLIYTFDETISVDFVHIDLKIIYESKAIVSDDDIIKTLVNFDVPIEPKPIERILLPDKEQMSYDLNKINSLLFVAMTTNSLYVIHECEENNISYARINGHFDIVSMHENNRNIVYTARGGIIDIYVWACENTQDIRNEKCHYLHTYELYASIDISSSSVTRIKPIVALEPLFLCSMENGVIHMYQTAQIRETYEIMPPFPRTYNVIETMKLYDTIAVTLDSQKRNGSLCSIIQESNSDQVIEFKQTNDIELKIPCAMMLSTIVTLDPREHLVVFADNLQTIVLWFDRHLLIYIDINQKQYFSSTYLKCISTEQHQNSIVLHFDNRSLVLCQIELDKSKKNGSVNIIPLDSVDLFCFKQNCLATMNNKQNRINLYNIHLQVSYKSIELENECEQICLHKSAMYIFILIKPRILNMYRIDDGQQMAKLFLYDFVSSMKVNDDFIVLAMNDRRLLTLMIADPNDPNIQEKIQALPSRNERLEVQSATIKLVQHIEKCADMNLNDDNATTQSNGGNQTDNDDDARNASHRRRYSYFCYVENLYEPHYQEIMDDATNIDPEFMAKFSNNREFTDKEPFGHDLDIEDHHNDGTVECTDLSSTTVEQQQTDSDLDDIRQKSFEYEQKQLKSVQLANAGKENLKIINSYSVTSTT
ncbi:unnamed protein product, partial [Rotaria sp. Silwood1]